MNPLLEELVREARAADPELGAEDLLDLLWLAAQRGDLLTRPAPSVAVPTPGDRVAAGWEAEARNFGSTEAGVLVPPPLPSSLPAPTRERETVALYAPSPSGSAARPGRPLSMPAARALPHERRLQRAFRPWMRRAPSRVRRVLDVEATVHQSAEEDRWVPVERPVEEAWLTLTVVVDGSRSMLPWRPALAAFVRCLTDSGRFRAVRVCTLDADSREGAPGKQEDRPPLLTAGFGRKRGAVVSPLSLREADGRQVVLVLSDTVARKWWTGAVARHLLEPWARALPVVLVSPLAEPLWRWGHLGRQPRVLLRRTAPLLPNRRLTREPAFLAADLPVEDPQRPPIPMPATPLRVEALEYMARWLADCGGRPYPGRLLPVKPMVVPQPEAKVARPAPEIVDRFRRGATPLAGRLAARMAAAPVITLPILRLIRQQLPGAGLSEEAEVLLGGLLRRTTSVETDPDQVRYEFRPGADQGPTVRDLLLTALRGHEILQVMREVFRYLEARQGGLPGWAAALDDPTGNWPRVPVGESELGRVTAELLRRLGGAYARLVQPEEQPAPRPLPAPKLRLVHPLPALDGVVERPELAELEAWFAGDRPACCLSGARGAGKSTLLAMWLHQRFGFAVGPAGLRKAPDPPVFHFSLEVQPDPLALLDALLEWLPPTGTAGTEPAPYREVEARLAAWSARAPEAPLLLVVDGAHVLAREDLRGPGRTVAGETLRLLGEIARGRFPGARLATATQSTPIPVAEDHWVPIPLARLDEETSAQILRNCGVRNTGYDFGVLVATCMGNPLVLQLAGSLARTWAAGDPQAVFAAKIQAPVAGRVEPAEGFTVGTADVGEQLVWAHRERLAETDPPASRLLDFLLATELDWDPQLVAGALQQPAAQAAGWKDSETAITAAFRQLAERHLVTEGRWDHVRGLSQFGKSGVEEIRERQREDRRRAAGLAEAVVQSRVDSSLPTGPEDLALVEEWLTLVGLADGPAAAARIYEERMGGYAHLAESLGDFRRGYRLATHHARHHDDTTVMPPLSWVGAQHAYGDLLGRQGNVLDPNQLQPDLSQPGLSWAWHVLVYFSGGGLESGLKLSQSGLQRATVPEQRLLLQCYGAYGRFLAGDTAPHEDVLTGALQSGSPPAGSMSGVREHLVEMLLRQGRHAEAEAYLQAVSQDPSAPLTLERVRHRVTLAEVRLHQGRADGVAELLDEAEAWASRRDAQEILLRVELLRARRCEAGGEIGAALNHAAEGVRIAEECRRGLLLVDALCLRARLLQAAGALEEAGAGAVRALRQALAPEETAAPAGRELGPLLPRVQPGTYAWGEAEAWQRLGEVGLARLEADTSLTTRAARAVVDHDGGLAAFSRAVSLHTRLGHPSLPLVRRLAAEARGILEGRLTAGARGVNPVDGAELVWVPLGEFTMGDDDSRWDDEKPAHQVRISRGFWLYRTPVTVAQYRAFCEATGRELPEAPSWGWKDDHPVVNVRWEDAAAYSDWAGARLPNEAQWEYAARGPESRRYPWGDEDPDPSRAVYYGGGRKETSTAPVGSKLRGESWCGGLDLAGNVWEWCRDDWDSSFYARTPEIDPVNEKNDSIQYYVLRGGSWNFNPDNLRAAYRNFSDVWNNRNGFRPIVCAPED